MTVATGGLGWGGIVRLGLVQSAIGAMVMLSTSLLNRVAVVEYALPAAIPAALVAWHYAVQLSRPLWGHGSDRGRRRTPWIVGGMATLAFGSMLAVTAAVMQSLALAIVAYTAIGAGVGAAGTSLLALLAAGTAPARRPAAASLTWIMMIVGIIVASASAGQLLEPFSTQRLFLVVGGVSVSALIVALLAVRGIERASASVATLEPAGAPAPDFRAAIAELWADPEARRFSIFVFVSMLAYSMQDMILEPFAGLMFAFTPGQSTSLAGVQHMGVLAGMLLVGFGAGTFGGGSAQGLRGWTVAGCLGSAVALTGLAVAARVAPDWPITANVVLLGFANGVFAVAAIGSMMALAGRGGGQREGIRMGAWGASQAIAFGLGGLTGAAGVDILRRAAGDDGFAFSTIFVLEGALFLGAAWLAIGAVAVTRRHRVEAMT